MSQNCLVGENNHTFGVRARGEQCCEWTKHRRERLRKGKEFGKPVLVQNLNSGLSLNRRSASQTQEESPKKGLSFSGVLSNPFGGHLSNLPHIRGVDGIPSDLLRVSIFIFSLFLRQEPSRTHCATQRPNGLRLSGDSEFPLLCPSLQRPHVLPVGSAWCCPPRSLQQTTPRGGRPHLGDAHLHLLQHLEELRRLKDKEGTERWGVSQEVC